MVIKCEKQIDQHDTSVEQSKNPCSPLVLVAQWIKCMPDVRQVMGLIPVGDSDFSLFHAHVMLIFSLFTFI